MHRPWGIPHALQNSHDLSNWPSLPKHTPATLDGADGKSNVQRGTSVSKAPEIPPVSSELRIWVPAFQSRVSYVREYVSSAQQNPGLHLFLLVPLLPCV